MPLFITYLRSGNHMVVRKIPIYNPTGSLSLLGVKKDKNFQ